MYGFATLPARRQKSPGRGPRAPAGGSKDFRARWSGLVAEIADCRRCPLYRSRHRVVVYRGPARPRVLFIGEAPGYEEDLRGLPFVGRAGQRLERAVQALRMGPQEYGVANLIKCRPPANRFPPASARACREFLDRQIGLLDPEGLVPLGRHALHGLLPRAGPISSASGRAHHLGRRWVFPLLHPAAALHDPRRRERWERDVRALRRFLLARRNPITRGPLATV